MFGLRRKESAPSLENRPALSQRVPRSAPRPADRHYLGNGRPSRDRDGGQGPNRFMMDGDDGAYSESDREDEQDEERFESRVRSSVGRVPRGRFDSGKYDDTVTDPRRLEMGFRSAPLNHAADRFAWLNLAEEIQNIHSKRKFPSSTRAVYTGIFDVKIRRRLLIPIYRFLFLSLFRLAINTCSSS